jgi:hypothetical protein
MKWFKHFTDMRGNPKLHSIEKKLGEAGYARACKLLEIIGARGGSGELFTPRLDLSQPHTDLGWSADELKIDKRSLKVTLVAFAKYSFIDPREFDANIIYVPQMQEYVDEWTGKRKRHNSGVPPESLRTNSPQSKSQSKKSESDKDKEKEVDDKSESDHLPFNSDITSIEPFSSNGTADLTTKRDLTKAPNPGQFDLSRLPAWMHKDPWEALEIDRTRVPKKFLLPPRAFIDGECDLTKNFECRYKRWWDKYRMEFFVEELEGTPIEFAEFALGEAEDEDVEYPPILLRRKKELEAV